MSYRAGDKAIGGMARSSRRRLAAETSSRGGFEVTAAGSTGTGAYLFYSTQKRRDIRSFLWRLQRSTREAQSELSQMVRGPTAKRNSHGPRQREGIEGQASRTLGSRVGELRTCLTSSAAVKHLVLPNRARGTRTSAHADTEAPCAAREIVIVRWRVCVQQRKCETVREGKGVHSMPGRARRRPGQGLCKEETGGRRWTHRCVPTSETGGTIRAACLGRLRNAAVLA